VMIGEGPRHSHRRGVGGIVDACGAPAIQIVMEPTGVTVPLGHHNTSLPGLTIAPCVDSLLCYRIDQAA
jgi:hypothetical protein